MSTTRWLTSTIFLGVTLLVVEQRACAFPRVRSTDTSMWASSSSGRISGSSDGSGWSLDQSTSHNPTLSIESRHTYGGHRRIVNNNRRRQRYFRRDVSLVTIPRGGTSSSILQDEEQDSDKERDDDTNATKESSSPSSPASIEAPSYEYDVDDETIDGENDKDDKSEEGGDDDHPAQDISQMRVMVVVKTNLDNELLDHRVETMLRRNKDVGFVKGRVQRDLPGKIPILAIELLHHGQPLPDEMLLDELCARHEDDMDDDDDVELDEDGNPILALTLNILPTVDKKFAVDLQPKIKKHYVGDENTLPTDALLDAYFLNQAAMERNAQLLANPNQKLKPETPFEMKNQAKTLREQLQSQTDPEVWEKSLKPLDKTDDLPDIRGQRYRSGKGGATTSLKKNIQTFLNVDWDEAIWTFLMFLFFGFFGGRSALSKNLLLLAAPMSLVIQTRPFKIWLKTAFYMLVNPPDVLLTLLPAPQKAILGVSIDDSYAVLYGSAASSSEQDAEDDEEEEVDDEDMQEDDDDDEEDEDDDDE